MDKKYLSYNVKDFGAKGDGLTDDTEAIQRALNYKTGYLFFPKGKYIITERLLNETR